ncbi:phosphoglycerate mutase-like protein, partial [Ascobolus immersus RN42]
MLERIYIARHGFRSTWVTDSAGNYTAVIVSPTGIPTDPPLASHGVSQAKQLASHLASLSTDVRPQRIYSSPYYRCLQTITPTADDLNLEIHLENGIGEWFGFAPFTHPGPATPERLHQFFPRIVLSGDEPIFVPRANGEKFDEVHDRCAYVLARLIEDLDREWKETGTGVKSVLLCGHAASVIAMGRALRGDVDMEVRAGTASLSEYMRVGFGGGWDMVRNGDCSFLEGGEERNWWF